MQLCTQILKYPDVECYLYKLQRKQSDPHSFLTKFERSFGLITFLKIFKLFSVLMSLGRRHHNKGQKYLIQCLLYVTVLKRGMTKSLFRKLY